jgi:ABC-type antimicrobial peptide transport system permease subunit
MIIYVIYLVLVTQFLIFLLSLVTYFLSLQYVNESAEQPDLFATWPSPMGETQHPIDSPTNSKMNYRFAL